jgi:hypothetical protein
MMATMPGLPMFGHGQIEGLTEKYGMEYRRAYWDEGPDEGLIRRHEREISPLLHRRHLFAGVENFLLYDFFAPEGYVNEDVFAYSNRVGPSASPSTGLGKGEERALVVYHNRYEAARGWVRTSVAYSVKTGDDGDRVLVHKSLGQGLGLHDQEDYYCIFRDHVSGLEYIRPSKELCQKGLYVELGAYKCHVFLDFREVQDNAWHHYAHLTAYLNGRGVPSIQEALKETFLQPVHHAFKELVNAATFQRLIDARLADPDGQVDQALLAEVEGKTVYLLGEIKQFTGATGDETALAQEMRRELEGLLRLPVLESRFPRSDSAEHKAVVEYLTANLPDVSFLWGSLLGWWCVHSLGKIVGQADFEGQSRSWVDEWLLGKVIAGALRDLGLDEPAAWQAVGLIKLLTGHQRWFAVDAPDTRSRAYQVLKALLQDDEVQLFLQVNRYQGVLWFNKEAFGQLLWWLLLLAVVAIGADPLRPAAEAAEDILACYEVVQYLHRAEGKSGYQVEKLLRVI